ncbi:MAG TPA: MgtC/SapB family protein [Lachnospiraceae bacterium]|nr:MgtC/SapB family protein [Lachnospiraceae bacterium]
MRGDTAMWPAFMAYIRELNLLSIVIRLLLALITGLVIGVDRGMKRRGAGIKTHVLVCLGSALAMMTGQYILNYFGSGNDVGRIGAQVVSGVGFLGVGTIIVTGRNQVRGLTTAAGLWACACTGLAIGIGFYEGALIMLFLVVITLAGLAKLDLYVFHHSKVLELYIEVDSIRQNAELLRLLREMDLRVASYETMKSKVKNDFVSVMATLELPDRAGREDTLMKIRSVEGVVFVEEL